MQDEKIIRVAFYIRVSTDEQAREGYGIEMQVEGLREMMNYQQKHHNWIHNKNWEYIDEGFSGGDLNRPALQRLIEDVKEKKIDIIAVYKIDRLSRNLSHLLYVFEFLKKNEIGFYSLKENIDFTSGAIGRLTFHIFGAMAEFERDLIKQRTIEGKIASARLGNYVGNGIPYGYKKIKNPQTTKGSVLEIVPSEAKWIKQMFDWFVYERKNFEEIASEFNDLGLKKGVASRAKDKRTIWHSASIRRMLMNSTYAGTRIERIQSESKLLEIEIPVKPIISETQFQYAQTLIGQNEQKSKRGGGKNIYLLSRKIIDKETGRYFVGVPRTKGGYSYRRKQFKDHLTGIAYKNREIQADALEDYVWEHIQLVINHPKKFFEIYQRQTYHGKELERLTDLEKRIHEQIKEEDKKLLALHDDYYSGGISEEKKSELELQYKKNIIKSKKRITEIEQRIKQLTETEIADKAIEKFSEEFKTTLDNLDRAHKQAIVDMLVDKVEVYETEENLMVIINFRFAQPKQNGNDTGYEPASPDTTPKNGLDAPEKEDSGEDGWKGYIRYVTVPIHAKSIKHTVKGVPRWTRRYVTMNKTETMSFEKNQQGIHC